MANQLRDFAKRHGIDLSLANLDETKKILKKLPTSLSDEIVKMREGADSQSSAMSPQRDI